MLTKIGHLISFILFYPLFWIVSRLNFFLLYKLSDLMFYVFYYLIRYRRKTVRYNLNLVFPEKTKDDIVNLEIYFQKGRNKSYLGEGVNYNNNPLYFDELFK